LRWRRPPGVVTVDPHGQWTEYAQVNAKKLITLAAVAFVLFFLISQPGESATAVHNVLNWLRNGAEAIVTFVKALFA
jgi:hypothetical protein